MEWTVGHLVRQYRGEAWLPRALNHEPADDIMGADQLSVTWHDVSVTWHDSPADDIMGANRLGLRASHGLNQLPIVHVTDLDHLRDVIQRRCLAIH